MKIITKLFFTLVTLCIFAGLFLAGMLIYFSYGLPKISTLADYNPPMRSQILAKDGTVLADIGVENREMARIEEIPPLIIDSFLAAEDANFFNHEGIDYLGVIRALLVNLKAGKVVQGGSTITQQVAKSLLLTRERSISRKIRDLLLARRIEKRFTKEEILFLYLNQIYLGGGYYGIKSAFKGYFNKELSEVTLAESAMIAGILVAPGRYSPYVNPVYAKKRQQYVLGQLLGNNKISGLEYKAALKEKIKYMLRRPNMFKAGYFTDWVRQRVSSLVGEEKFLKDGFRVVTTLDYEMQKVAEEQVRRGAEAIDRRQGFKGPIGFLEDEDEIEEFEIDFRRNLLRKNSLYFTLGEDLEKKYELEFDEENFNRLKEHRSAFWENVKNSRFHPGKYLKDVFDERLETGKVYDGVVLKTDDWARIIYISIGGVFGIIPYTGYNWAHERVITEQKHFYPYVTRPSTIVKKGDLVKVEIQRKSVSGLGYFNKNFRSKMADYPDIKEVKKQRYLLCKLTQVPDAQAALVSVSSNNNEILAFVGGYDFGSSQFNRAVQSKRQPGSAFKPILFAAALEHGYNPSSIILDSPEALGGGDVNLNWKPSNYDGKFKGPITLRNSLEQSRNVPTIKLAEDMGVPFILDFVDRIVFEAELEHNLSLALGSFGVTLLDLVATYAIFPKGGKIVDPKSIVSITDRHGNQYTIEENHKLSRIMERELLENQEAELDMDEAETLDTARKNPYQVLLGGEQVYDKQLSYIMTNLLKGVVQNGTGRRAKSIGQFIGGKTGTTNNYVDAWFIGFSSNVTTGVWTGFDDNKTLGWGETGAKAALPIWREYMRTVLKKYGEYDFPVPPKIINVMIDKETGQLASQDNKKRFMEAFVEGTEPGSSVATEKYFSKGPEDSPEEDETVILEDDDYYNNQ